MHRTTSLQTVGKLETYPIPICVTSVVYIYIVRQNLYSKKEPMSGRGLLTAVNDNDVKQ